MPAVHGKYLTHKFRESLCFGNACENCTEDFGSPTSFRGLCQQTDKEQLKTSNPCRKCLRMLLSNECETNFRGLLNLSREKNSTKQLWTAWILDQIGREGTSEFMTEGCLRHASVVLNLPQNPADFVFREHQSKYWMLHPDKTQNIISGNQAVHEYQMMSSSRFELLRSTNTVWTTKHVHSTLNQEHPRRNFGTECSFTLKSSASWLLHVSKHVQMHAERSITEKGKWLSRQRISKFSTDALSLSVPPSMCLFLMQHSFFSKITHWDKSRLHRNYLCQVLALTACKLHTSLHFKKQIFPKESYFTEHDSFKVWWISRIWYGSGKLFKIASPLHEAFSTFHKPWVFTVCQKESLSASTRPLGEQPSAHVCTGARAQLKLVSWQKEHENGTRSLLSFSIPCFTIIV